jgi:hypothetical protein
MNLSATLPSTGEPINLVEIMVDGSEIYMTYVSSASDLRVTRVGRNIHRDYDIIATNVTINT